MKYLCKLNYVNTTLRMTCRSICSYGKYVMTTKSAKKPLQIQNIYIYKVRYANEIM